MTNRSSSKNKPRKVQISSADNKDLECLVCGNNTFVIREGLLNTGWMTALGLDWANRSAKCCICSKCGHIHWFA